MFPAFSLTCFQTFLAIPQSWMPFSARAGGGILRALCLRFILTHHTFMSSLKGEDPLNDFSIARTGSSRPHQTPQTAMCTLLRVCAIYLALIETRTGTACAMRKSPIGRLPLRPPNVSTIWLTKYRQTYYLWGRNHVSPPFFQAALRPGIITDYKIAIQTYFFFLICTTPCNKIWTRQF